VTRISCTAQINPVLFVKGAAANSGMRPLVGIPGILEDVRQFIKKEFC
jgi:hypothetical protein